MRAPLLALAALALAASAAAPALALQADLNGDGVLDAADEALLAPLYGSAAGDPGFAPSADVTGDGRLDHRDLALFGAAFGATGSPDTAAPGLFVTLNGIRDAFNDLLVVPPEGFRITLELDAGGGSLIDPASLSVIASEDMGSRPAGSELAGSFEVTPTGAAWEVPAGSDLARTSHYLDVQVRDRAGNLAQARYGYAVRDFASGPPLGSVQRIFLDFGRDRSGGPEVDFLEDLREYGLSSAAAPAIETRMRDRIVRRTLERARRLYGREADGAPGPDAANVRFTAVAPAQAHARLCVGGSSSLGGAFLGAAELDPNNLDPTEDTCSSAQFGVFPQAVDNLWGGGEAYAEVLGPVDPDLGGTPVGEDPLDAVVTDPAFDPTQASSAELARWLEVTTAADAFADLLGAVAAHETGHLLGLVAHGPTPGGLFGGESGARTDHNVDEAGAVPAESWLMNPGGSFGFDAIVGRSGEPPPAFRGLAWAYLRDRIAPNRLVTGLFPPPTLESVQPNPAVFAAGQQTVDVAVTGTGFLDEPNPPVVELKRDADATWKQVQNEALVGSTALTGTINRYVVYPGLYDVRLQNADGQVVVLPDQLEVIHE